MEELHVFLLQVNWRLGLQVMYTRCCVSVLTDVAHDSSPPAGISGRTEARQLVLPHPNRNFQLAEACPRQACHHWAARGARHVCTHLPGQAWLVEEEDDWRGGGERVWMNDGDTFFLNIYSDLLQIFWCVLEHLHTSICMCGGGGGGWFLYSRDGGEGGGEVFFRSFT